MTFCHYSLLNKAIIVKDMNIAKLFHVKRYS
jgi:hypothetical protein